MLLKSQRENQLYNTVVLAVRCYRFELRARAYCSMQQGGGCSIKALIAQVSAGVSAGGDHARLRLRLYGCHIPFELILTLGEPDKSDIRCPKCGSKNVEEDAVAFYAVTSKKS